MGPRCLMPAGAQQMMAEPREENVSRGARTTCTRTHHRMATLSFAAPDFLGFFWAGVFGDRSAAVFVDFRPQLAIRTLDCRWHVSKYLAVPRGCRYMCLMDFT